MSRNVIFESKNILVTGGAGFIGSHLCDELVKNNKVICIDNFITGNEKNIDHLLAEPNFVFIKHDITKSIDLENAPELQKFKIEFQGIQEIYHLACPMSPNNFYKNRIENILANSYGIKNVLDLALKYNAKFLHFSSSVVYGINKNKDEKITEDALSSVELLSERSSYDEGKRFAEAIVQNYHDVYKIDTKIIRLFRIYGPRMPLRDGQMIPDFINNALDNKDLIIYGDKNFSSSFCYISDCIDAATKLMDINTNSPINIGSDIRVNLTELANKIINVTNAKSTIKFEKELLFMKPLCVPNISAARNELGWLPVISLEKGIENTIYELRATKGVIGVEHVLRN